MTLQAADIHALNKAAKIKPTPGQQETRVPELNLALQCHFWGCGTPHSPRQSAAAPSGST